MRSNASLAPSGQERPSNHDDPPYWPPRGAWRNFFQGQTPPLDPRSPEGEQNPFATLQSVGSYGEPAEQTPIIMFGMLYSRLNKGAVIDELLVERFDASFTRTGNLDGSFQRTKIVEGVLRVEFRFAAGAKDPAERCDPLLVKPEIGRGGNDGERTLILNVLKCV